MQNHNLDDRNPYHSTVNYDLIDDEPEYEYAGFWIRVLAAVGDSILFSLVTMPIAFVLGMVMGASEADPISSAVIQITVNAVVMVVSVILWVKYAGTPVKRLLKLKVLDAETGEHLSYGKAVIRYLGYIPATVVLFLGLIWVAFDKKKQGWHDKMAGSVVVKEL